MSIDIKAVGRRLRLPLNKQQAFRRLAEYHKSPRSLSEVADWAMNFGGKGYMRVNTQQVPSEIYALAERVKSIEPQRILEIGTARGGTLLIWAALASEQVISCDLNDMRDKAPLLTRFPPPGSDCEVTLLSGDSHSATFKQRVAQVLGDKQLDFLFIDGDHTEAGVTADYLDYKEFVRPGGLIGFHDIVDNQPLETNQVGRLWKRLKAIADTEEFVNDPGQCGFGIGLLRVGEDGGPDL